MIHHLISTNNLEQLQALAKEKGSAFIKNSNDTSALGGIHLAASLGNVEILRFLLGESISEDPNRLVMNHFAPLHAAAMNGHAAAVRLLINHGANVNVQTQPQGYAPVHSAAFGGHLEVVKLLVTHGADLTLRNYRNEQAIDTARRQHQVEVVRYFEGKM